MPGDVERAVGRRARDGVDGLAGSRRRPSRPAPRGPRPMRPTEPAADDRERAEPAGAGEEPASALATAATGSFASPPGRPPARRRCSIESTWMPTIAWIAADEERHRELRVLLLEHREEPDADEDDDAGHRGRRARPGEEPEAGADRQHDERRP